MSDTHLAVDAKHRTRGQRFDLRILLLSAYKSVGVHASLYAIILAWTGVTFLTAAYLDTSVTRCFENYLNRALNVIKYVPALYIAVGLLYFFRNPERGFVNALKECLEDALKSAVPLRAMVGILTFTLFMGCFLFWKMQIPHFSPFTWDVAFASADKWLFGGRAAYELFLPLYEREWAISTLDYLYWVWTLVCVVFWIGAFCLPNISNGDRNTYLVASVLTWLLAGTIAATLLASAGPVYYGEFTGDFARFAGLIDRLTALDSNMSPEAIAVGWHKVLALNTAEYLLRVHQGLESSPGGISAMPSMHNAQALLFMLAAFRINRWFGCIMAAFLVAIFIGSIVLAWHYAVDAFVSFAIVLPIWFACTRIFNKGASENNLTAEEV